MVTVTGTYTAPGGSAAVGTVEFAPLLTTGAHGPATVAVLSSGAINLALAPGNYLVTERVGAASRPPYYIVLPSAYSTYDLVTGPPTALTAQVVGDVFTGSPDTASITGRKPLVGPAWLNTGSSGLGISGGLATATATGYAYQNLNPDVLTCDVVFSGDPSQGLVTMAWSSSATFDLLNLVHFNFWPYGFNLTVTSNGGGALQTLLADSWDIPLAADGVTVYHFEVAVEGDRIVILAPNGEVRSTTSDPRVSSLRGNWCFWELIHSSTASAAIQRISAYSFVPPFTDSYMRPTQLGSVAPGLRVNDTIGAPEKRWGVSVGQYGVTFMPGITFGSPTVRTQLVGSHSSGGVSLNTLYPIAKNSTVLLDTAPHTETVTVTASAVYVPVSGGISYWSHTITALAGNHAANSVAVATAPALATSTMYYNTETGSFFLPPATTFLQGRLYTSAAGTANINEVAPGLVQISGSGSALGSLLTGFGATAGRPPATFNGAQWYDTTLHKPIWSDGTNWRDASGSVV